MTIALNDANSETGARPFDAKFGSEDGPDRMSCLTEMGTGKRFYVTRLKQDEGIKAGLLNAEQHVVKPILT